MRQFRTYGSVRGAAGNRWPYRDPLFIPSDWNPLRTVKITLLIQLLRVCFLRENLFCSGIDKCFQAGIRNE